MTAKHNTTSTSKAAADRMNESGKDKTQQVMFIEPFIRQAKDGRADDGYTAKEIYDGFKHKYPKSNVIASRLSELRDGGYLYHLTPQGFPCVRAPKRRKDVVQRDNHGVFYLTPAARDHLDDLVLMIKSDKKLQPKENKMAPKKKAEKSTKAEDPREWEKKCATVLLDQVGEGKALDGFTYDEMRKKMGLSEGDEGYDKIPTAMTNLRNWGFAAHKFSHPSLKEDFYEGDPTDIPNIQKRDNAKKIRQLVFYAHPAAIAVGDSLLDAVDAEGFPEDFEYENPATVFDREGIYDWFDGLGEIIDLYVEDDEQKMLGAKMIAALMPVKE